MKTVTPKDFGKDHNSLIAYLETLQVDSANPGVATIDKRRMRTNPRRHPLLAVNINDNHACSGWEPSFGTRLAGYWGLKDKENPKRRIGGHDDWDCLGDLEAAGLIEILSIANGYIRFTDKGLRIAADIRAWKAKGGNFADFRHQDQSLVKA
jgi:hypothetical protein